MSHDNCTQCFIYESATVKYVPQSQQGQDATFVESNGTEKKKARVEVHTQTQTMGGKTGENIPLGLDKEL